MEKIYFIVEGSPEGRDEAGKILAKELGTEPERVSSHNRGGTKDPGLIMAAAALVFSVPAAILSAFKLKERIAAKKKLEGILAGIESMDVKMKDGLSVSIRTGGGKMMRLNKSSLPGVLEALSRLK